MLEITTVKQTYSTLYHDIASRCMYNQWISFGFSRFLGIKFCQFVAKWEPSEGHSPLQWTVLIRKCHKTLKKGKYNVKGTWANAVGKVTVYLQGCLESKKCSASGLNSRYNMQRETSTEGSN